MVWENMPEDHNVQEYFENILGIFYNIKELFYQAIDASFNYVLLKIFMKDAKKG